MMTIINQSINKTKNCFLRTLILLVMFSCSFSVYSAIDGDIDDAGDIVFTAYHDTIDGLAFLFMDDCPIGEVITFTDSEWIGSSFNSGEGDLTWTNTTGAIITKGTLIIIQDAGGASMTTNIGSTVETDSGFGTANGDQVYAMTGTRAAPVSFLAFVGEDQTLNGLETAVLSGTGLTAGVTAHLTSNEAYYNGASVFNGTSLAAISTINSATWNGVGGYTFPTAIPTSYSGTVFNTVAIPTVTTTAASSITVTSATLAGNATADGGASITERGVVYSITATNADPLISGTGVTKDINGTGTGVFSESISGLVAGTQYSYKAYATNSAGTSYGTVETYTTSVLTNPTITFADISKIYGDADFTLGATTNSGGTISYTIEGVNTTGTSLSGTNNATVMAGKIGSLAVRATVTANGIYSSGTKDITLTINAKLLTISADSKSKFFGEADPTLSYQLTSGSLESGDSLSGSLTRVEGAIPGNYLINQGDVTAGSNYAISYNSANLSILANSPIVTITSSSSSLAEASGSSTITATLSQTSYENVTINLSYTGTASNDSDFTSAPSITIATGQTMGAISLTATQDVKVETDESIAIAIFSISGGNASESGTQSVNLSIIDDDSLPTVSAVVIANGNYKQGDTLDITVTLTDDVTVSGTNSTLAINIGGTTRQASFISETSGALLYQYTVQAGETDIDGVTANANGITANGDTFLDNGANDADLTFSSVTNNAGLIDTTAPTFDVIRDAGDARYVAGDSITLTLDMGESGLIVTADLSVLDSDFSNSQALSDNGDGTYSMTTVALNTGGNMQEGTAIAISYTATDTAGNSVTDTSQELWLDNTAPEDPAVTIPASTTPAPASTIISGAHSEDGVSVFLYADNDNDGIADSNISLDSAAVSSNTWSFTVNLLNDENNFVVAAIDALGNRSVDINVPTLMLDSDEDGIPDDYEMTNGLDPNVKDANDDHDSDGISNIDEYVNNSNPQADDYAPVIDLEATVVIDATGILTPLPTDLALASDGFDGDVAVSHDLSTELLAPGRYIITWSSTDNAGNSSSEMQTLDVRPLANWQTDQETGEDNIVSVTLYLNGEAPEYPVVANYTLTGSASNPDDHDAVSGTFTITEGQSASVDVAIVDDLVSETDETILFTLDSITNAVIGVQKDHQINISELNHAPSISLLASLDSAPASSLSLFATNDGQATITATVSDVDAGDSHSFVWSDNHNLNGIATENTYSFNPATAEAGVYQLAVTTTDDAVSPESGTAVITLTILDNIPTLVIGTDSDGDGVDDSTEGLADSDGDNVPDFADSTEESNLLAMFPIGGEPVEGAWFMEVQPGLSLQLNVFSSGSGDFSPLLETEDIVDVNEIDQSDVGFVYDGGLFDFIVSDMPVPGETVFVIMPQLNPIPENAVYRKELNGQWFDYIEDDNNFISSAPGGFGICPPPGSTEYLPGLTEGYHCVQLGIEDGGVNDADGAIDGTILDPGGVAIATPSFVRSSGGAITWPLLLLLGLSLLMRKQARQQNHKTSKGA